ncbi:hypothetical protein ACFQEQ_15640, partial [Halolamina salina]
MDRREFLAALGAASTVAAAGCSSDGSGAPFEHPGTIDETMVANGDYPDDGDPADGLPPEFPDPPE